MTEIDKMYENAGINKREIENCTYKNSTPCGHSCDDGEDCPYLEIKNDYPPFTAEKQLELIKLLTRQCDLTISHFRKWEFLYFDGQEPTQATGKDFSETFAKLVNAYWEFFAEKEKEQIRKILNDRD